MGQKILVVEDNELNLKLFCDLLRAHGYEAEPVRDGREAVERARAFGPELVIMDIQMPYVSGLELIEQLKADEELKRTPIMAVTAYAAKGDEERIRDAGAEGYVSKPISLMRFIEAVRALLPEAGAKQPAPEEGPSGDLSLARRSRESGNPDGVATEAVEEADRGGTEATAQGHHSRESGNPDEGRVEVGEKEGLDARFRGDDEEGAKGTDMETAPASAAEGGDSAAAEEASAPEEPDDGAPEGAGVT